MHSTVYEFSDSVDSDCLLKRIDGSGRYSIAFGNKYNGIRYSMELSDKDLLNFVSFIQQFLQTQQ